MAKVFIDGKEYTVRDGSNYLAECLSLGFDLPYFCWHPAMGSVGACRQCAIKQFRDENDTRGKLVMACMTPVTEGARISVEHLDAREFRRAVAEWLMVNHPHDCPVCDEGGECHLQDMIVMTGHDYRRYRGEKRTFRNQYLGPFVNHEMNRCIQCYRCVRFYRDYARGRDFNAFMLRKDVYFGRGEDGVLESAFSGNLVEVCPTGVFTDKTLKRHYTRKWDLQTAPSVCVNCGVGCNTIPGERYGMLRRIRNRYNGEVNGYFLCDRGRYGYEFVNSERRIRTPLICPDRGQAAESLDAAMAAQKTSELLAGSRVIGIGSPRASLEANFALRTLAGPENFCLGVSGKDLSLLRMVVAILQNGPARSASLRDVEMADAVLVLGEDVSNTAPMIDLALRQSIRHKPMEIARKLRIPEWDDNAVREAVQAEKGPLFVASPYDTNLDEFAAERYRAAPDDLARLGFTVAHAISNVAPSVTGLPENVRGLAERIASGLKQAERPLVISGTASKSEAVLEAAANVAWALCEGGKHAQICLTVPECNSLGVALMGGKPLEEAAESVRQEPATLLVLENDLYRRAEASLVDGLLGRAKEVIAIDHLTNATTDKAGIVLPAATFAEADGTLVNNEGRAQRFYQVFVPQGEIQESWRWLRDLMTTSGRTEANGWHSLDDVMSAMAEALPVFRLVLEIAPPASFRVAGTKVPREPARWSGRTAIHANVTVHEPRPPEDPDSPLSFSMEGDPLQPPPALIPRFWASGWNSIQALNKFQEEVAGPLRGGDPGKRLIEPEPGQNVGYLNSIPGPFETQAGRWLAVPTHHIFGSEELSVLSPGVAGLMPVPYLALNAADAQRLGVAEGQPVEVRISDSTLRFPLKIVPGLPSGVAGLPIGLPVPPYINLPAVALLSAPQPEKGSQA